MYEDSSHSSGFIIEVLLSAVNLAKAALHILTSRDDHYVDRTSATARPFNVKKPCGDPVKQWTRKGGATVCEGHHISSVRELCIRTREEGCVRWMTILGWPAACWHARPSLRVVFVSFDLFGRMIVDCVLAFDGHTKPWLQTVGIWHLSESGVG